MDQDEYFAYRVMSNIVGETSAGSSVVLAIIKSKVADKATMEKDVFVKSLPVDKKVEFVVDTGVVIGHSFCEESHPAAVEVIERLLALPKPTSIDRAAISYSFSIEIILPFVHELNTAPVGMKETTAVVSIPRPFRHKHIDPPGLVHLEVPLGENVIVRMTSGFVTSTGEFVTRKAAVQIAFDAGQIRELKDGLTTRALW